MLVDENTNLPFIRAEMVKGRFAPQGIPFHGVTSQYCIISFREGAAPGKSTRRDFCRSLMLVDQNIVVPRLKQKMLKGRSSSKGIS